jgi:hypothetical protein
VSAESVAWLLQLCSYPLLTPVFICDGVVCCLQTNNLQMIVRAHECVMDGFERFAQGHLITLFSATNYCGTAGNAGAILVLGRDLVTHNAAHARQQRRPS